MNISAVLFDLDHTLGFDNQLEESVLSWMVSKYCHAVPSGNDEIFRAPLLRFRSGKISLGTMVEEAFRQCGFHAKNVEGLVKVYRSECLKRVPDHLVAFPKLDVMVSALQEKGIHTAILSNGWKELQHAKAKALQFFGPVLTSEELGAWKPSREAFERACSRLDFDLPTTLYAGDNPETDVMGAKSAGMHAAWVNMEKKTYPPNIPLPDLTITSLPELAAVLNGYKLQLKRRHR